MFVRIAGARFRVLRQDAGGAWVIAYDEYQMPVYINRDELECAERIAAPEEYVRNRERPMSAAQQQRYDMLRPALDDARCITDEAHRIVIVVTRRLDQPVDSVHLHGYLFADRNIPSDDRVSECAIVAGDGGVG